MLYTAIMQFRFNYGAELADPKSLFKGPGRLIRHLKIKNSEDIKVPDVRNFIKEDLSENKQ